MLPVVLPHMFLEPVSGKVCALSFLTRSIIVYLSLLYYRNNPIIAQTFLHYSLRYMYRCNMPAFSSLAQVKLNKSLTDILSCPQIRGCLHRIPQYIASISLHRGFPIYTFSCLIKGFPEVSKIRYRFKGITLIALPFLFIPLRLSSLVSGFVSFFTCHSLYLLCGEFRYITCCP